jgi:serpin B
MNLDRLVDYLDETTWSELSDNLLYGKQKVWLKLPRFKIECEMGLNEPVKNTGMKRIFTGGFANISDVGLAVSYIKQKTFVEVNEEGTEAAAVTVIALNRTAAPLPNEPVQFFANRPFLYLIKEKSTGAILFIGRMDEPQE